MAPVVQARMDEPDFVTYWREVKALGLRVPPEQLRLLSYIDHLKEKAANAYQQGWTDGYTYVPTFIKHDP